MSASLIADGRAALKAARWQAAADAFGLAVASELRAEALLGLGQALWWLGDARGGMARLEDTCAAFTEREEPAWAETCGLRLAFHQRAHLANRAAAEGGLARATRLIDTHALEFLHGELRLIHAYLAHDPRTAEAWAREALERGRVIGDRDLELSALSQLGACLVDLGRVDEGLALLGEAMAACLGRETENLETVVFANCATIVACARCADFTRAAQWARAGKQLADRHGIPYLDVECRAVFATVQFATGHWHEAEELARAAIAMAEGHAPAYHAAGVATIARIRLARGRLEEAARLVSGFEGGDACLPIVARLQLMHGKPDVARLCLTRRLDLIGGDHLECVPLVELLGEADLAEGDPRAACQRAGQLIDFGVRTQCRTAWASGERLHGRALAPHTLETARQASDRALAMCSELAMPYEIARTRPTRCARATASFRFSMGERAMRGGPKGPGLLTGREQEVFALVGDGLSNPEIAERLCISRKTVEHHVAHILGKLGLKNRAQAAAEAVRHVNQSPKTQNQPRNR